MINKFTNAPPNIFNSKDYVHYLVEYIGDLASEASKSSELFITIINNKYAIMSVPFKNLISTLDKDGFSPSNNPFTSIVYISRYYYYTLQSISPIDAANFNITQIQEPFYLTGKGVVIGMIDTGIDYLNKEFINIDGNTRILNIWDQSISSSSSGKTIPFGTIYSQEDINNAIKASNSGNNPYDIVPSKDEIGHGTAMAGIIGAKGFNPSLRGAAPDCEYVIVKLALDNAMRNVYETDLPIYSKATILAALNYLYEYSINNNKPIAIYLPLGTTFGNHRGNGVIEDYIDEISNNKGIIVITGSGNEGDASGHASGIIRTSDTYIDVPFSVSKDQKFLKLEIWVDQPNVMSVDVISPSGNHTGLTNPSLSKTFGLKYVFEETIIFISYFLPEELTGDELIVLQFLYVTPGIWKIRLYGDFILTGTYNMWMSQKGISKPGTKFINSDSYATFTNPGSSKFIINTANYNQNNLFIVEDSGLAFPKDFEDVIDLAAGGVNALAPAINNSTVVVNGTSVSAAVVTGACAILLQWGIIEGNDPGMYSQKMKTYLLRGTGKRPSDVYPNAEWGYGFLDMAGIFKYLE